MSRFLAIFFEIAHIKHLTILLLLGVGRVFFEISYSMTRYASQMTYIQDKTSMLRGASIRILYGM